MPFRGEEIAILTSLEQQLRRVEEWPLDSPLAFVIHLAPRTRGKLGEMLIDEIAASVGLETRGSGGADFDRFVVCADESVARIETKFSTEDPPRFQQVRDPRRTEGMKYDYLVCISGRPEGLVYWVMGGDDVAKLMDAGKMVVQHAMSDTKWFFPLRIGKDNYANYRCDFAGLRAWLTSL